MAPDKMSDAARCVLGNEVSLAEFLCELCDLILEDEGRVEVVRVRVSHTLIDG